jgi:RNA polymerase sigma-70 factor (ECF subfamily)
MPSERIRTATDEQLARDARAGCVASFEELARRVQVPLVRFLTRRFPSRRDAEDVTQEALLKAYQGLGSYRDGRSFKAWVFTIAYRTSVSRGRGEPEVAGELPASVAGGEDPADVVTRREGGERVWRVAREVLGEESVMALWLYYVEEMPAGEVARVMGRSWVSVKTMLHRARKRLGPYLVEDGVGEVVRSGGVS